MHFHNFDYIMSAPKEYLHQLCIGLYGKHIITYSFYQYTQVLCQPHLVIGETGDGNAKSRHPVSNMMLADVWIKLRNRLSSINSGISMIEISSEYASHFYNM